MTRAIIAAAGESLRWQGYRGTPKHLTAVSGEVLLHRTCRQLTRYTDDIVVVGRDERYAVPGTQLYHPHNDPAWLDLGKVLSSRELWATAERTVLLFGDMYFTDNAVAQVMSSTKDWVFFLRPGHSSVHTGRPEVFGLAFDPSAHALLDSRLELLVKHKVAQSRGGWCLYRDMIRPSYGDSFRNDRHVKIDDLTTDLDYPSDLDSLEAALGVF